MLHANQQEYYNAINTSNNVGESTIFIAFMLSVIKAARIDAIKTSDEISNGEIDKATLRWMQIEKFLQTYEFIMNADVKAMCGISAAMANQILAGFVEEGKLVKVRKVEHLAYKF